MDPIELQVTISQANAVKLRTLLATGTKTLAVAGHVSVFSYDQIKKAWYTAFDCALGGTTPEIEVNDGTTNVLNVIARQTRLGTTREQGT